MQRYSFLILFTSVILHGASMTANCEPCRILIISGSNNHLWQETSPFLQDMLTESGHFVVDVTERPDTLRYSSYKKYDALISNWNSWPDNDIRWPTEAEEGLLHYVSEGGGLIFFHASTSALYSWPAFKTISTGAWVEDTWHGKIGPVYVKIENQDHPLTKGLANFSILDELWINAERNDRFQVLGSAYSLEGEDKASENQPAVFVLEYGRGREDLVATHSLPASQNILQGIVKSVPHMQHTGHVRRRNYD